MRLAESGSGSVLPADVVGTGLGVGDGPPGVGLGPPGVTVGDGPGGVGVGDGPGGPPAPRS